jgi:Asp-tRNA(Asn)/Glu-tRNA(Gln) amidotransferase A subunit family amidase
LNGLRLGILTSYVNHTLDDTSHQVSNLFAETCRKLSSQGVELIEFDNVAFHPLNLARAEVQLYEMQDSFTEYLTSPTHPNYPSLDEISTSGMVDGIAVGPTWPLSLLPHMTISSPEYLARLHRISRLKLSLAKTFAELHLDGIIFPHQTILVVKAGATFQPGRNGLLSSLTGTPGLVVPMGFSQETEEAVRGVPVGMEIIGLWGDDWKVLGIAEMIEKVLDARKEPVLFS